MHGRLSERLAPLTFTGRKSGQRDTTPVAYAEEDDILLIGTASGWSRTVVGDAPVVVWLRGHDRPGVAEVIADEPGMTDAYRTMLTRSPGFSRAIAVRLDPAGAPNPDDMSHNRAQGHVVVRVAPDPPLPA